MRLLDEHVFPFINDRILGPSMDSLRCALLSDARGAVLEIGTGTGLNAKHYPPDARVSGVEPSKGMRLSAQRRLRDPSIQASISVFDGNARALPFDAGSFDIVVSTFVLCSVRDIAAVLAEVRRVLRSGGALRIAEHVKSPDPSIAAWQMRLRPLWTKLLGGCEPAREIKRDLDRAGFDVSRLRPVALPLPALVRAGIVGEALRP